MASPSALPPPPPKRKRSASPTKVFDTESGSKATATEGDQTLNPGQQETALPPVRAPFPVVLDGEEEEEEEESSLVHRSRRRKMNPTNNSLDPHAGVTPPRETPESDRQDQMGFGPEMPAIGSVLTETSR